MKPYRSSYNNQTDFQIFSDLFFYSKTIEYAKATEALSTCNSLSVDGESIIQEEAPVQINFYEKDSESECSFTDYEKDCSPRYYQDSTFQYDLFTEGNMFGINDEEVELSNEKQQMYLQHHHNDHESMYEEFDSKSLIESCLSIQESYTCGEESAVMLDM